MPGLQNGKGSGWTMRWWRAFKMSMETGRKSKQSPSAGINILYAVLPVLWLVLSTVLEKGCAKTRNIIWPN